VVSAGKFYVDHQDPGLDHLTLDFGSDTTTNAGITWRRTSTSRPFDGTPSSGFLDKHNTSSSMATRRPGCRAGRCDANVVSVEQPCDPADLDI